MFAANLIFKYLVMLKNISTLGKPLSKEAQQNIFGGMGPSADFCEDKCWGTCADPNHTCSSTTCVDSNNNIRFQNLCVCTSGGDK